MLRNPSVLRPLPKWSFNLRNLYYRLRYCRSDDIAGRRRFYRYIRDERDFLQSHVPAELIRVLCRALANPQDERRLNRFWALFDALLIATGVIDFHVPDKPNFVPPCDLDPRSKPRRKRTTKVISPAYPALVD